MIRFVCLRLGFALLLGGCAASSTAPEPRATVQPTACNDTARAAEPWAGAWRARSGDAVITISIASGKVRGELISPVTTFAFTGGVSDTGYISITMAGNDHWDRAEMNGTFPTVELRAGADGRSFQTMDGRKFRLCT